MLNRKQSLKQLNEQTQWDVTVIGGGATGLGIAVDAARRGYKVLLLEKNDFAKGTSGKSTKLVHGGVRYLAQGNIKLVMEALRERGFLLANAPHLTHTQYFVIPVYSIFYLLFYGIGLALYALLSGKKSLGKTKILSKKSTLDRLPGIRRKGLKGGILYADGQFDDARLAVTLALTAADHGAIILNYFRVSQLLKTEGRINGLEALDEISGQNYRIRASVVINATGVFADSILQMDNPGAVPIVMPSQGVHLVVNKSIFPAREALMIPKTKDGRVLFAVPWHDAVVIGTTDTPRDRIDEEPKALEEEINFILDQFNRYREKPIDRSDVSSVFAGLRPLVKVGGTQNTAALSRDHTILVSESGLLSIIGGKWTTYRKMAKDAVDRSIVLGGLPAVKCMTGKLRLHGYDPQITYGDPLSVYGTDAKKILQLMTDNPDLQESIHPDYPYTKAEVMWSVRNEMALQAEDILARRSRLLYLDARAALQAAPGVVSLMAKELGRDEGWQQNQLRLFQQLAADWLPGK